MPRDLSQEPLLPVNDIQGDILLGLPKRVERLLFFKIEHAETFKSFPVGTTEPLNKSNSPDEDQAEPGQDLLWPGEFVFGYPGQDPNAPKFSVKGPEKTPPTPAMKDGAFLVFRRQSQHVPEFRSVRYGHVRVNLLNARSHRNLPGLCERITTRSKEGGREQVPLSTQEPVESADTPTLRLKHNSRPQNRQFRRWAQA